MKNVTFALGFGYMGICALAIALTRPPAEFDPSALHYPVEPLPAEAPPANDAVAWYLGIKPYCNTVEVETALAGHQPAPATTPPAWHWAERSGRPAR